MFGFSCSFTIIAAHDRNRVIGRDNALLWRLKRDMQHFKEHTSGKVVLMGRRTFESIGRPLPHRRVIVMTRDKAWWTGGVESVGSLTELSDLVPVGCEVMVAGGALIYQWLLPYASKMLITEVHASHSTEQAALFPEYDTTNWHCVASEVHPADADNDFDMEFLELHRISPACYTGVKDASVAQV